MGRRYRMGSDPRVVSHIRTNDTWAPSREVASPGCNQFSWCLSLRTLSMLCSKGICFSGIVQGTDRARYKIALGTPVVQGPTWLPLG